MGLKSCGIPCESPKENVWNLRDDSSEDSVPLWKIALCRRAFFAEHNFPRHKGHRQGTSADFLSLSFRFLLVSCTEFIIHNSCFCTCYRNQHRNRRKILEGVLGTRLFVQWLYEEISRDKYFKHYTRSRSFSNWITRAWKLKRISFYSSSVFIVLSEKLCLGCLLKCLVALYLS